MTEGYTKLDGLIDKYRLSIAKGTYNFRAFDIAKVTKIKIGKEDSYYGNFFSYKVEGIDIY